MLRERTVAFVVARLSSSRLPAKQLRMIGDRCLLDWTVGALKSCQEVDEIVITTVAEDENKPLRDYARAQGLSCFWYEGEVDDVTGRLRKAAEHFKADICILVSADCPLVYAPAVDSMVQQFKSDEKADFLVIPAVNEQVPALEGIGIARLKGWQVADNLSLRPELREHQFPVIWQQQDKFTFLEGRLSPDLYSRHHRFSVDTPADLEFMNRLHDLLQTQHQEFDLPGVLQLLSEQPDLYAINQHVHQRQLAETVGQVLMVIDSGAGFGYGHLNRSLELGQRIIEQLGWPVTFLVDDGYAAEVLHLQGLRFIWGALGRCARAVPEEYRNYQRPLANDFTLVVLDLYPRPLPDFWQDSFPGACLVALDSLEDWTSETDLVVIPAITGPEDVNHQKPDILQGLEFLIIRRDIRQAGSRRLAKDIDVLIYGTDLRYISRIEDMALQRDWKVVVVDGTADDFHLLLARSRFFVGNFGYSFYEALFLKTVPVALPISLRHKQDAILFYQRIGLPDLVVSDEFDAIWELAQKCEGQLPPISDGTSTIVNVLQKHTDDKIRYTPGSSND